MVQKLYLLYGVESEDAVAVENLQDAVEESSIDAEPEISLCEISGAPTPQTVWLQGNLQKFYIVILIMEAPITYMA